MRKSLSYKILAALMAAGSFGLYAATPAAAAVELTNGQLRANGNAIVIKNNELTEPAMDLSNVSQVYGVGYNYSASYKDDADDGNVTITNSTFNEVYGGYTDGVNGKNTTANNNTVTLNNSNISNVYGGYSGLGSAKKNIVKIDGGNYGVIIGGSSGNNADSNVVSISNAAINNYINNYIIGGLGITNANGNKIEITNSTVSISISSSIKGWALTGGYASSGSASSNQAIITDSTISGNVYGGYIVNATNQLAENNSITITGNSNIANANLYGYATYSGTATGSNNTLTLNGWSGSTQSVQNFNVINFENIKWNNDGTVLNITDNKEKDALANTNIKLNKLNFSGGTQLNTGDSMTFVKGTDLGIDATKVTMAPEFTAGVATVGTGDVEVDENSVKYTLTEVKQNDQIDLVAENRAVAAAFVNQGTDLISDSLDTISRDDNYGVKTFAAVHGNRSKYDVNSDIKINGWSVIAGVGNADKFDNGSEFSWGVFYENGSGNYRTYNEFNNEFFRGDGSLVYNGGGIAARYTNKNGVYTEGSLRAGMLKSDMDNALRDGAGNFYGYESESAYYGAHLGIGKIISLSESSDLDVYGKFFHTYTEGDSFKVAGDEFEFDSINSDRLRVGARITSNKENKFSTYYGLAYEYEFNGDADMTAQGLKAPTQSLQGSSVMAEVGFNYQPTPTSPWSFDLNMRGYAGERQGGSFNVQATYTF